MKPSSIRVLALLAVLASVVVFADRAPQASGEQSTGVVESKTISRVHLVGGHDQTVETRNFSLNVGQTQNLRGFQEIDVSWSGAHPTGGIIADQNSGDAMQEEYPVVLLECSGVDSASGASNGTLDPTTCWTATAPERFQSSFNTAFPPWRVDRYAAPDQRTAVVGAPAQRPAACFTPAPAEHWVPFRAASGAVYYGGGGGCAGMAPEAANVGGLSLPSNTTYGVTDDHGDGSAKFDVWTADNNSSLGCSDTSPCSLVAVPILGISCDATAAGLPAADRPPAGSVADDAFTACSATGRLQSGQIVTPSGNFDMAVSGALWWSASNWRNRVSVPLTFAPLSNVCDVVGGGNSVDLYGSELMTQATVQWAPKFCLDPKLFRFKHVQTPEPQARTLVASGNVEAALSSDVPAGGFSKPIVNAPVAVTGFAIAFAVDDGDGRPAAQLRLTPRLLAKLLTESYPAINAIKEEYPALAGNPLDISLDPEFIALNPGVSQGVAASQSASTLLALSSDSDVMSALTAYINNDPDARSWLDGAPDPWGMVVNPNYKGVALPTASWPLLDSFEPPKMYASDTNDCLFNDPVPFLPLVAAPMSRLSQIAQQMQFSIANSQTVCQQLAEGTSDGEKLVALGRQTVGHRFMLGVVSLADASRFSLSSASLLTQTDATAAPKYTNTEGRTFVAPSTDSLHATAKLLTPDLTTQSWPIPYAALSGDAAAYPGTMVVYAQVPTAGLPAADATKYAGLLRFAVSDGQTPGTAVGQLPDGYLPMTAANDLAPLVAYTLQAADAIQAQQGAVPSVIQNGSGPTGSDMTSSPAGSVAFQRGVSAPLRATGGQLLPTAAAAAGPTNGSGQVPAVTGTTIASTSQLAGLFVPALALAITASAGGALLTYRRERRRSVVR